MRSLRHVTWMPLLLILVLSGCDQVIDIINPPAPPPTEPVDLTVTPNGGAFTPAGLTANEQAVLIAGQSLSAGDGTMVLQTLKSLDRLLAQLGEEKPPMGAFAAPPVLGLQGRLAPERALELSRPAPITLLGTIDATVEGNSFSGTGEQDDTGMVHAEVEVQSADGTQLSIAQSYSRDPQNLTYQLSVAGTLVVGSKQLDYEQLTDYDQNGDGIAAILIRESGDSASLLGYDAKLLVEAGTIQGAEAVTLPDGFWTVTKFDAQLAEAAVEQADFLLNASNGFAGQFSLAPEGTGTGEIVDGSDALVATLSVSPQGDLLVQFADGGASSIIQF